MVPEGRILKEPEGTRNENEGARRDQKYQIEPNGTRKTNKNKKIQRGSDGTRWNQKDPAGGRNQGAQNNQKEPERTKE
jgi:hypothetical protein